MFTWNWNISKYLCCYVLCSQTLLTLFHRFDIDDTKPINIHSISILWEGGLDSKSFISFLTLLTVTTGITRWHFLKIETVRLLPNGTILHHEFDPTVNCNVHIVSSYGTKVKIKIMPTTFNVFWIEQICIMISSCSREVLVARIPFEWPR